MGCVWGGWDEFEIETDSVAPPESLGALPRNGTPPPLSPVYTSMLRTCACRCPWAGWWPLAQTVLKKLRGVGTGLLSLCFLCLDFFSSCQNMASLNDGHMEGRVLGTGGGGGVADRERRERNGFHGAWARGGSTQVWPVSLLFPCCSPASLPHTRPAPTFLWL